MRGAARTNNDASLIEVIQRRAMQRVLTKMRKMLMLRNTTRSAESRARDTPAKSRDHDNEDIVVSAFSADAHELHRK